MSSSQEWRTYCITPIYKTGDRSSNYQPVSLLHIISNSRNDYIECLRTDCFTNHQFGFILGCFSLPQLVLFINIQLQLKKILIK